MTLIVTIRVTATESFVFEGLAGYLDNLSSNSEDEKESRRIIERATEGCSQQGHLRPWTEVILEQTFSKNTLPKGLADPLGMVKLKWLKGGCSYPTWSHATPRMLSMIG